MAAELRSFSTAEVESRAGKRPWTRQLEFSRELDTAEMNDQAAAYARAASEARDTSDLAKEATKVSQDAGGLNGDPLVRNGRFVETHRALQRGGSDMDVVVRHIIRSMNHAINAEKEVHQQIYRLNGKYQAHVQGAINAWLALGPAERTQARADEIRNRYLGYAVDDASYAYGEIEGEINQYRRRLAGEAAELRRLGYDLGAGPFDLFTTEGMAKFAAEGLAKELGKSKPDPDKLEFYTQGLAAIASGVYGNPFSPGKPDRDLTPEEVAYLRAFYHNFDAGALAALGALKPGMEGVPDVGPAAIQAAQRYGGIASAQIAAANGINMLLNPDINGIDPESRFGSQDIPAPVAEFVYGYDERISDQASLDRFNGFGGLMSKATIAPGDAFAYDMGIAALEVQEAVERQNNINRGMEWDDDSSTPPDGFEPLRNTGSSGLLSGVSLNQDASLELLEGKGVRERMLRADWQDSEGIADMVRGAINPGEDGKLTADQERVADSVITFYTDNPEQLIEDWNPSRIPPATDPDLVPLQGAVADAVLLRMDDIIYKEKGREGLAGAYNQEDRYGAFSLMAATDPRVNEHFKTGITTMQYNLAYEYFSDGGDKKHAANLGRIADLNAYVQWGEQDVLNHYEGREDRQNKLRRDLGTATVGAVLGAAGLATGPVGISASLAGGAFAVATPAFPEAQSQAARALGDYQLEAGFINNEMVRYTVVAAAVDANNADPSEEKRYTRPNIDEIPRRYRAVKDDRDDNLAQLAADLDVNLGDVTSTEYVAGFNPDDERAAKRRLKSVKKDD